MSSFYLILALIFSFLIAIVALANNETVTVSYIFGRSEVSLILLILGSAFAGALVMGLFSLFRSIRTAFAFREIRHKETALLKEIKDLKEEKIFLEAELNRYASVPESEVNSAAAEGEVASAREERIIPAEDEQPWSENDESNEGTENEPV